MKLYLVLSTVLACCATALKHWNIPLPVPPAGEPPLSPTSAKHAFFQQVIDHDNPSLGNFSQFYYYDDFYYKGPGSPVVLFTPGELDAKYYYDYLTTERMTGVIAKELGAATIVVEHRYWGESSPFSHLTTKNLRYLTVKNAIADLNNFALNVKLPFDKSGTSNADKAPWILVGGSYSGALAAWTEATSRPKVIWAYYASSAVVQAIGNFWNYYTPETLYMPKNCSADISRVIDKLDNVFENGGLQEQEKMKDLFGFKDLTHYSDMMFALTNGPNLWQGNQLTYNAGFFEFCDAVEGVRANSTKIPGESGVGVDKALKNFAKWSKEKFIPYFCANTFGYFTGKNNVDCFNTHNEKSPLYSDVAVENSYYRGWDWLLCNEPLGWWQTGAPQQQTTIVSRLLDAEWWTRQCSMWFPEENGYTYGLAHGKNYNNSNQFTAGWDNRTSKRLLYVNGRYDPWRQSTVSSTIRPGGPMQSTKEVPVFLAQEGYHSSDLIPVSSKVNKDMAQLQAAVVAQLKQWTAEFPKERTLPKKIRVTSAEGRGASGARHQVVVDTAALFVAACSIGVALTGCV